MRACVRSHARDACVCGTPTCTSSARRLLPPEAVLVWHAGHTPAVGALRGRLLGGVGVQAGPRQRGALPPPARDVMGLVHGGGFVLCGAGADLGAMGKLGGDTAADDVQAVRCLNRIIRWLPDGIAMEADPRHAELLATMRVRPASRPARRASRRSEKPTAARARVRLPVRRHLLTALQGWVSRR